MAAADSTAMTIDFLRARLLSERSVSRAAKERADELANRVAELEEQLREVTAQRRQAERATTEVLAILESQGFGGHLLSDADDDSGSDQDDGDEEDARSRGDTVRASTGKDEPAAQGATDDALSGTAQPGGLSWKGRSVSPRKARQLKQKHRRSYFYLLSSSSDSSPKYRMGQSCRKNKRKIQMMSNDGRPVSPGQDAVAAKPGRNGRHDGSDCTYDGQDDMDGGETGGDEPSSGDGGGGGQSYVIRYEKDGEMERVLERQAELIEQYEEEEKAQREWEQQYNENRNADNKVAAEVEHKPCQNREGREDSNGGGATQAAPRDDKVPPTGSLSESPQQQNTSQENGAQLREVNDKADQSCAQTAPVSAQESSNASSAVTRQQDEAEISDGDSCFNGNARASPRHCVIKTPSDGSPSSDTLGSKVSDWSSSHFHDHTDSQLDTQSYRPASSGSRVDVGSVLEALQRARIALSARLQSKPVPPSQVTLALPAPGDDLIKECDDLPGDDGSISSSYREEERGRSSPARQEILALPAPEGYHEERVDLPLNDTGMSVREGRSSSSPPREEMLALPAPGDDYCREIDECMKIPACASGLFRLPTDSFPEDQRMFASSGYVCGSGYGLGPADTRHASDSFSSNPSAAHCAAAATEAPSTSPDDGSGLSAQQYYDLYSSVLAAGRCNSLGRPEFAIRERETSFHAGVPGLGDADLFMQRGIDYTISNKWML